MDGMSSSGIMDILHHCLIAIYTVVGRGTIPQIEFEGLASGALPNPGIDLVRMTRWPFLTFGQFPIVFRRIHHDSMIRYTMASSQSPCGILKKRARLSSTP